MKTKGYAALSSDQALVSYEFERKTPGANDVHIDIAYCGICHSDIHQARNEWKNSNYPIVPGHEIVGFIKSVGSNVTKFKVGDRVGVGCLVGSCGMCLSCKNDEQNYCEKGFTLTYNSPDPAEGFTKGGYSQDIVVPEHFVLRMPDNLDLAASAPLLCAGITTYSPLKHIGLGKGHHIAVMGLGGLGHMALKLANSMGATVYVLSRSPSKKDDALKMGAHEFINTQDDGVWVKHQERFDFIIDTISSKHDLFNPLNCLKRDGTLVMVGASDVPLDLAVFPIIMKRRKIMGSLIGGIKETQAMLDHCSKHNIVCDIETIKANQINEAFERTLASKVKYRFVIDCATF